MMFYSRYREQNQCITLAEKLCVVIYFCLHMTVNCLIAYFKGDLCIAASVTLQRMNNFTSLN